MKRFLILAVSVLGFLAGAPAFADTYVQLGCEVRPVLGASGNVLYTNKVDPTCNFAVPAMGPGVTQIDALKGLDDVLDGDRDWTAAPDQV